MAGRVTGVSPITGCHHSAQGSPSTARKCLPAKIGKIFDVEGNHSLAQEQCLASGTCVLPRAAAPARHLPSTERGREPGMESHGRRCFNSRYTP